MMTSISSTEHQPPCLKILFLTEMWERFGFYIVQVMLIFYLTKVFHYSDITSAGILGAFTAISYITPIAGGWLADRFLGFKHSVILGGLLLSTGYAMLASGFNAFFYLSLATIAIGTGFFKPNISSYLGNFYLENDARCERGYTLFYIGINVGIILSTVCSGYILSFFGWRADFLSASIGLLIGVSTFIFGLKTLENKGMLQTLRRLKTTKPTLKTLLTIYLATLCTIILAGQLIQNVELANRIFTIGGTSILLALITLSLQAEPKYTGRMLACLMLIALSVSFWALYYQLFFSLNLFIDRVIDRNFLNHTLPSPIFISLMPLFIMIFGSPLGWVWQRLEQKRKNPNTNIKFALSLLCMAAGLLFLAIGTSWINENGLVNKEWVIIAYLLFALAELLLSPICIAMVIQLIPPQYTGIMMGAYLASIGFGAKLAGVIAGYAAIPNTIEDLNTIIKIYHHAFIMDAKIAVGTGLLMIATIPIARWLISYQKQVKVLPLTAEQ